VSPAPWQALSAPVRPGEDSFRAGLSRTLRRAVGLLARMQEEVILYRDHRDNRRLRAEHLDSLLYLASCAADTEPELRRLEVEAMSRNLRAKAADLQQTIQRLRDFLSEIARIQARDQSLGVA